MDKATDTRPMITIDLKKYRVRVHSCTLRSLGNPAYLRLLVNPEGPVIALQSSLSADGLTHRVSSRARSGQRPYEVYSQTLVQALHEICPVWAKHRCYRVYGEAIPGKGLVQFHLRDFIPPTE